MKINKNNYEAYLIDHFDGNLSPELEEALYAFVLAHPELEINLEDTLPSLNAERFSFEEKLSLKRSEALPGFAIEELILANLEGEASDEEQEVLNKLCADRPEIAKELERLAACYLEARETPFLFKENILDASITPLTESDYSWAELHEGDRKPKDGESIDERLVLGIPSINFPHKSDLIQKERRIGLFWKIGAAAAVIIMAVFFIPRNEESSMALRLASLRGAQGIELPMSSGASGIEVPPVVVKEVSNESQMSPRVVQEKTNRKELSVPASMETLAFEWNELQPEFDQQIQEFSTEQNLKLNNNSPYLDPSTLAQNKPKENTDGGFLNLREFLGGRLKERLDLPVNSGKSETMMALASQARQTVKRKSQGQPALLKNKKTDKFKTLSLQFGRFSYERK